MNRDEAWKLLTHYTKKDGLIKHALAVEAIMRSYARKFGENEELWGVIGLIHDFDYEVFPTAADHPFRGAEILEKLGFPEEYRRVILSHADYTGIPKDTILAKTLFAVDELAGFITAVALVRPSKKIAEVEVNSVRKKFKDKAFAASVKRDDIKSGITELGVDEHEHIQICLDAMKGIADQLGL